MSCLSHQLWLAVGSYFLLFAQTGNYCQGAQRWLPQQSYRHEICWIASKQSVKAAGYQRHQTFTAVEAGKGGKEPVDRPGSGQKLGGAAGS